MDAQTKSFRELVIDILSEKDGVTSKVFNKLVEHAKAYHPDTCDDIFSACGNLYNGYPRYHLRYDHAAKLKEVQ